MFWNELKIHFPNFIFWVINDFVHNFQVFLYDQKFQIKNVVSKDAQCSETDFCVLEFLYFLCDFYFLRYGQFCNQQWTVNKWLTKTVNQWLNWEFNPIASEVLLTEFFFWIRLRPECTTKVKYKITYNLKLKIAQKKLMTKIRFRTLRNFWDIIF